MCSASKGESKTTISHDTQNYLVLLDKVVELGLKKVVFLMKIGLGILPFPITFLSSWGKTGLCASACVHVCV